MNSCRVTISLFLLLATPSWAAVTAVIEEVGGDVVLTASGSLNLDAWGASSSAGNSGVLDPAVSAVIVGPSSASADDEYLWIRLWMHIWHHG